MRAAKRGFSLIEIVIVVFVLGILAGVAAPRYTAALRWRQLDAATRRIAADLREARDDAVRSSTARTVQFSVASDRYTLVGVNDPDRPGQPYEVELARTSHPVDLISADFDASPSVVFDVFGRPDNAGSVTVESGGETRRVDVSPSGRITQAEG